MSKRPSARPPSDSPAPKPGQAQKDLVSALTRLNLTQAAEVCSNAAVHADLRSFIASLGEAATKDADRHERQHLRQAAKSAGVAFPTASLSRFDTSTGRGVSKHEVHILSSCRWVRERENLSIQGPTQTGKSYLASALAVEALRAGHSVVYRPTLQLLRDWYAAYREGPAYFDALRQRIRDTDVLILDDFGEGALHAHDLGSLRELITERFDEEGKSLCVVSSSGPEKWEEWMSFSDEGKAVAARITNAFHKYVLARGQRKPTPGET